MLQIKEEEKILKAVELYFNFVNFYVPHLEKVTEKLEHIQ